MKPQATPAKAAKKQSTTNPTMRFQSHAAIKSGLAGSKTLHPGQPMSMPGQSLTTGHTATNTGKS